MTATKLPHSIDTQPLISTEKPDYTDTDSDDGVLVSNISEPLRQITRDVSSNRFYGKSSNLHFVKVVMEMKREANGDIEHQSQVHRPEFWNVLSWEITSELFVPQLFPEPELLKTLLEIFFDQINSLVYVVHTSSSEAPSPPVLTACALGEKFSEDPRVFLEGTNSEHSAGWRWFRQVRPVPTSFLVAPSLYDLQLICFSLLYLAGGSSPEECWTLVGLGVRMAYDVGAHRRIRSRRGDNIETEMRTFWMLLCSNTIMSSLMEGQEARYRVAGASAIYGALLINLLVIWRHVQDAIHPIKRKEQEAYQEIVAELDSALNHRVDSNLIRLNHSACPYVTYYILFPLLAICANAARSCGHVMEVQATRAVGPLHSPQIIAAVFDSATVLLLNVFHRSSRATNQSVQKCLNVLRIYECRWQIAGRNAHDQALTLPYSLKRTRWSEDSLPSTSEIVPDVFEEPCNIAGSKRIAAMTQEIEQLRVSEQEIERLLFLRLYTEDLGRLPIYESFDFDSIFISDAFSESAVGAVSWPSRPSFPKIHEPFETHWDDWSSYSMN
ncbi:hypothetical protein B0H17DRAFT_1092265 [Mycena rosella]|uniref:Xylanolytic transcriptional activator regulatory domain-containing protein n=1 Tax=Mycena rosella TaxID=1033263 RepID=A0AAD7CUX8_MYCRO|nr:hypothetical protein B0H17DRAFT_1092265 [Mycena rosella]